MSSLSPKDRVSLCTFTFSDGRRCRSPRIASHPHFCFCHAQKEARASAAEKLGKDLAYFFSGDYLSACDLSTALGRLIPAVVRGDVKPRTARTVAYLAQTLLQTIHLSKHEYINAFGTDGWRQSIRDSANFNHDHLFPPAATEPEPPAPSALRTNLRSAPPQSHPAPPHSPLPKTSTEFVQRVMAGLQTAGVQAPQPATPQTQPQQAASRPAQTPSEPALLAGEESAFSADHSPLATPHSPLPQPEKSLPTPTTHSAPSAPAPTAQPNNPPPTRPPTPQPPPNRDPYALHFDHNCRLRIDGKLL
jgi:hypothetical protein